MLTIAADGSYTYAADQTNMDTPVNGAAATDTFTYTSSDGQGGTDEAELVITVTGINDLPTATNDTGSGVASNDSDVDAGTLSVTDIHTGAEEFFL